MESRIDPSVGTRLERRAGARVRWRWFVLPGLLLLIWFAPTLFAWSPLMPAVIDGAVPQLHGQLRVGSASLGWLSPVVIHNLTWRDKQGNTLAEVSSVRVERSLYQLLLDRSDLGTIRIVQPRVQLALRDDGSNIEDALAELLQQPASAAPRPLFKLVVEEGTIAIATSDSPQTWTIQQLGVEAQLPNDPQSPSQVAVRGKINDVATPAAFDAAFDWHAWKERPAPDAPGGSLLLKTEQFPLAVLRPLVRRALPGAELSGSLSCDVQLLESGDGMQQKWNVAQIAGRDLVFAAPQWLGRETLRLSQLGIRGQIDRQANVVKLSDVELASDFAQLTASGQLERATLGASLLTMALQPQEYEVRGEIDLARLAAMLPETLHIREGTKITSGVVSLSLASSTQGKKHRWDGELKSSRLAATQNGREIVWDQPITMTLAAQQSTAGPVIERLACEASFLKLQARGTFAQGELTADGDLAELLREANRFLDLDEVRLAGKLDAQVDWKLTGEQDFQAQGQSQITNFVLESPGRQPWQEPQLNIDLSASGVADKQGLRRLDRADVRVVAGEDQLLASLAEAVATPGASSTWPLRCTVRGDMGRWLPRLQGWLPLAGWQATGGLAIDAAMVLSPEVFQLHNAKIDITNLQASGQGMRIVEPEVRLAADGVWNYRDQQFTSESLTLASSAIAFRADKLVVQPRGKAVALAGEVGYRSDLTKLALWWQDPREAPMRAWQGASTGRVQFTHQNNTTVAKWTSEFDNLALLMPVKAANPAGGLLPVANTQPQWKAEWQEEKLTFSGHGELDHARDQLTLNTMDVMSQIIRLGARGKIAALTTSPHVDLVGDVAYDLQGVASLLASYIGPAVKMSGTDKRQFLVRGSLPQMQVAVSQDGSRPAESTLIWPKEFVAQGGIGWNEARLYELPIGKGSIDAALQDGVVNIAPLDLQVAEGRLKAWPRFVLNNNPMVFQLAKGSQVEQLQITREMCQAWLKYVAPLMADATRAEGTFSGSLEGATLPLVAPDQGDMRGTLTVHGARIGPGPATEQYVLLARQIRLLIERKSWDPNFRADSVEWVTLPQQEVPVQLTGGRVYHRGLQLVVGDTTLVSSGSVGMVDQTLNLTIDIPIRDEWVAKDRLLASLRGQTLKVPVGGTVDRPQIDNRALQQLAGQLLNSAAGGLIENEIQKGLDKLFKPK